MPRYVAFLRAVNVGGRTIRMERLREIFAKAGFTNVETFIASGNVMFDSRATNAAAMERKIEAALEAALGYAVATFVRRADALAAVAVHQPFPLDAQGSPGGTVYVGFLRLPVGADQRRRIIECRTDVDDLDVKGQELYWLVRGNLLDSKLSGTRFERELGETTIRNRNTIVRIVARLAR